MSVRSHRKPEARKPRVKLPDYVRKAGPHKPRDTRRNSTSDVIRRALQEAFT